MLLTQLQLSTFLCVNFFHRLRNIFLHILCIKCLSLRFAFADLAIDLVLLGNTVSLNRNSSFLVAIVDKL